MDQKDNPTSEKDKTFEYIFNNIIDGIVLIDAETEKPVLSNRAICMMLGYTQDELVNISIYDIHPKEILQQVKESFQKLLNKDIELIKDVPVLTREKKLFYADIAASPMYYNGRINLAATFRKITGCKDVEKELKRKEELLRTTLNTTADGILLVDKDNKISQINRQLIEMWKVPKHILDSGDDKNLINYVIDLVEDPSGFIEKVEYLYNTDLESFDEIRFRDGRTFERYSSPLISEGVKFGRVWDFKDITSRKHVEEELRKNEAILTSLFDAAPVGIALLVNRIHIKINNTLCEITGYAPEEIIGHSTEMMYCTKEDSDRVSNQVYSEVKEKGYSLIETRYRRKDGSAYQALLCVRAIDVNSPSAGVVIILIDITERKQAEEALRNSEALLRSIFEASPSGISLHKIDRTIIKLNHSLCRITGYSEEELLGKTTQHLYLNDDEYNRVGQTYKEMERDGLGMAEARLRRKDGSVINVLICLSPVNPGDLKYGVIATVLDVTVLKKTEQSLMESEEKYRSLVENMQDAAYRCDLNGNLVFASPSAVRMLGCTSPEAIIGMNLSKKFYYYTGEREKLLKNLHEHGKITHYEVTLKRMDNCEPVIVSTNSQFYYDKEGNISGIEGVFSDITERKKAEEALRKSEALFSSIFEASPAGILLIHGRIPVKVNNSFCRITGYSEEEIVGKSTRQLYFSDEEYNRVGEIYYNRTSEGLSMIETFLRRKDGSVMNALICLNRVNPNDEKAGDVAITLDITGLKHAEEALKDSETFLRKIFDVSPIGIVLLIDRMFVKVNSFMCKMAGYSEEELLGKSARLFYPDDEEFNRVGRDIYPQTENGGMGITETRVRRKDGSIINILLSMSRLDTEDIAKGVVVTALDITERKRAEEDLKKNEAMLKSLLDATPIGVSLLINRVHIKVNNSLCKIVGYTEEELIGKNTLMLYINENEYMRADAELNSQMEKTGLGIIESRLKRKDGIIIDVILCLSPFDPEDISAGLTFTALDITERKRIEAEKSRLEEMLLHSQKIESLGRLAGGIAHDFNNLLTAIMGNTEMAMRQLDPEGKPYSRLTVIKNAAEGAANLTRQLLAFSRKQIIEPKVVNLNDLIEHVYKVILTLIGENIKLSVIPGEKVSQIKADPGQVEQIIINLVANARDAMPGGGILTIETSGVYLDDNYSQIHPGVIAGDYVMMAVSDTGTGMNKDILDHAFEPFFTTKEKERGTGLGLATVYGIVKQNGGTIEVYSEIDCGTVFKVYFPVSSQIKAESPQTRVQSASPVGSETILVVEDKAEVLEFCRDVLIQSGYNVLTAESGEEALSVVQNYKDKIHMLMTDIILPGINGRSTAEKILALRGDIKILYNSGYTAEVIDKQGVLEKGINFISKPFTSHELSVKVREILDKKH